MLRLLSNFTARFHQDPAPWRPVKLTTLSGLGSDKYHMTERIFSDRVVRTFLNWRDAGAYQAVSFV
jgi:hypothetical protein